MCVWTLLLLLSQTVLCEIIPSPVNVSIWSFNMEHILKFEPGTGTPARARFTVQTLSRTTWTTVPWCMKLRAELSCNLTGVFTDPLDMYRARVQAFSSGQKSNWSETGLFLPLSDTVLGPPVVSLSGCGNCLLLRVTPPNLKTDQHLELFRELSVEVKRSRDGAHFRLTLLLEEESRIEYLQRGVEYCVTVVLPTLFNSNSTPSKRQCALTSPPQRSPVLTMVGVISVLSVLFLLLLGCVLFYVLFVCAPGQQSASISSDAVATARLDSTCLCSVSVKFD